jgi:RimJ/RimL family protein N-acetyltransferase
LRVAEGGIDSDLAVIRHVRRICASLHAAGENSTWLMVAGGEVVGLCGFHAAPSANGEVELGYNVAPSRRLRGYATAAIRQMLDFARSDNRIKAVVAIVASDNAGSRRALEQNAFAQSAQPANAAGELRYAFRI